MNELTDKQLDMLDDITLELFMELNEREYTFGHYTVVHIAEEWFHQGDSFKPSETEAIVERLGHQAKVTLCGLYEEFLETCAANDDVPTDRRFGRYINSEDFDGASMMEVFFREDFALLPTAINMKGNLRDMLKKGLANGDDWQHTYIVFCGWDNMEEGWYTVSAVNVLESMKRYMS